jgi:hypothetical protein
MQHLMVREVNAFAAAADLPEAGSADLPDDQVFVPRGLLVAMHRRPRRSCRRRVRPGERVEVGLLADRLTRARQMRDVLYQTPAFLSV